MQINNNYGKVICMFVKKKKIKVIIDYNNGIIIIFIFLLYINLR